jgi:putative ABC transport system ATP-binding protein
VLKIQGIFKSYLKDKARVVALAPIDMSVQPGEMVAVQGPSGSGKTTLLLIAAGLLHPDSGQVLLLGHDLYSVKNQQPAFWRSQHIGVIFQQYHLLPYLSVLENILLPDVAQNHSLSPGRGLELMHHFGLDHRRNHFPGELSTGEKQRTALARALLFAPKLILADEITGNLDQANTHIVMQYLKEYVHHGGSVLLVTHDQEIAKLADRLLFLQNQNSERNAA